MALKPIDYTFVKYEEFLEYVLPYVPGVPKVVAERCIRDAAIDFCDETKLYEQVLEGTYVPAGLTEFQLELPPSTKLAGVNMLTDSSGTQLLPLQNFIVKQDIVELTTAVTADSVFTATVALKPSRSSTSCPTFLFEDWVEVISNGAQALLFSMTSEEWASDRYANMKYALYRGGVAKAKRYARTGRIVGNTRVVDVDFS